MATRVLKLDVPAKLEDKTKTQSNWAHISQRAAMNPNLGIPFEEDDTTISFSPLFHSFFDIDRPTDRPTDLAHKIEREYRPSCSSKPFSGSLLFYCDQTFSSSFASAARQVIAFVLVLGLRVASSSSLSFVFRRLASPGDNA